MSDSTAAATPRFRPTYKTCKDISALCPVSATTYGYVPILAPNALFTAWFALLAILALGFGIKSKTWTYTLALFIGTALEALGYGGRLMMTPNPWNDAGFKMQICCLVLAPSALAACIYLTLKHLVNFYGPEHSILKPRLYPWIFVGCDIASMCIQAIGGGVAASASQKISLINVGNRLIVAGIAFQVATMTLCGFLMVVFIFRYRKAKKNGGHSSGSEKNEYFAENPRERKKLHIFCFAVGVAYVTILIRCIYRLPEMAGGWGNPLMQNEKEFLILDGAMIAIGSACLTIFHPAFFFKAMTKNRAF